jgi:hypothetical protein
MYEKKSFCFPLKDQSRQLAATTHVMANATLLPVDASRRRFYNPAQRDPIYNRCVLPALNTPPFLSPNVVLQDAMQLTRKATHQYHNNTYSPPAGLAADLDGNTVPGRFSAPFSLQTNGGSAALRQMYPEAGSKKRGRGGLFKSKPVDGHLRTFAVRMVPTREQRLGLKRIFFMARLAYNFTVERVRQERHINVVEMRKRWKAWKLAEHPEWVSKKRSDYVATMFEDRAIKDVADAVESALEKRKNNPEAPDPYAPLGFRCLHNLQRTPREAVHIETGGKILFRPRPAAEGKPPYESLRHRAECLAFMGNHMAPLGGIRLQDRPRTIAMLLAEAPKRLAREAQLLWDKRLRSFHLLYTYEIPKLADTDPAFLNKRVVACDPGVQPFQAWYSPTSGEHGALLCGGTEELVRRCHKIDAMTSKLDKVSPPRRIMRRQRQDPRRKGRRRKKSPNLDTLRQRRRRRRQRHRLKEERARLRGWVKDAHYDAAHTLLDRHHLVLMPHLPVAELVVRSTRAIAARTARAMLTWSHSLFCARLHSAAARYPGRHVLKTTEPGTSKTCTHCGNWKHDLLPRDKIYFCIRCGLRADRQMAGARNNFFAAIGFAMGVPPAPGL